MIIRMKFDVDIDSETFKAMVEYARECGFDYDNPPDLELVQRLLANQGKSAIVRSKDNDHDSSVP